MQGSGLAGHVRAASSSAYVLQIAVAATVSCGATESVTERENLYFEERNREAMEGFVVGVAVVPESDRATWEVLYSKHFYAL